MLNLLRQVFFGPDAEFQKDHLTVRVYLIGGQEINVYHVKSLETTKTPEGGFASYKIMWHDGFKPTYFSLTLDHISAIAVQ